MVIKLVSDLRSVRSEMNVPAGAKVPLELVQEILSRPRSSEALPDSLIGLLAVVNVSALVGAVMVITGAVMSGIVYMTLSVAEPLFPVSSAAVTVMTLAPSTS
mgnify:CR=1 FL=1